MNSAGANAVVAMIADEEMKTPAIYTSCDTIIIGFTC